MAPVSAHGIITAEFENYSAIEPSPRQGRCCTWQGREQSERGWSKVTLSPLTSHLIPVIAQIGTKAIFLEASFLKEEIFI